MIDLGFPQYCSLAVLSQLSERATFISIEMQGYNTEIENISQKDSTFGRLDLVGVTSHSSSGAIPDSGNEEVSMTGGQFKRTTVSVYKQGWTSEEL